MHEGISPPIDSQPHPARVYDCLLDGKDNYLADQAVAEELSRRWPDIRKGVHENRAWMHRVVRHLAAEAGMDQFLDIGTGIPTSPNLHEVAQRAVPASRVVYVDNDPVVLSHAGALLKPLSSEGSTTYLEADLREPERILAAEQVRETLDMGRPVALMLVAILHFLEDREDPDGIVRTLVDALPSGSYVAISHACGDEAPEDAAEAAAFYRERKVSAPVVPRGHARIEEFFTGLELIGPGVVPVGQWMPEIPGTGEPGVFHGGVARKA